MTQEDKGHYRKKNIRRFCGKETIAIKSRDRCLLTGKKRGPAHQKCNINLTQKHSKFIPFVLHNFSIYDFHLFFRS